MEQATDRYTPVMAQCGIPDPRQANSYPGDGTLFVQWAWEFLRRRDDYRAQWLKTIAPYLRADGEFDETAWERANEKIRRQSIAAGQPYHIENPFDVLARNFGLHASMGGFDPRRSHGPAFEARFISLRSWLAEQFLSEQLKQGLPPGISKPSPWPLGEYECAVTINVSLPLKPQFEAAGKILQDFVRKVPPDRLIRPGKPQTGKFARYLRVLDFDAVGEADAAIGEHLFPRQDLELRRQLVRDSRSTAREWRHGYLRLVAADQR